jgi:hypothetical protein
LEHALKAVVHMNNLMMGDVGVYIVTVARTFADCFWKVSVTISSNMSVQTDLMLDYRRERSKCSQIQG